MMGRGETRAARLNHAGPAAAIQPHGSACVRRVTLLQPTPTGLVQHSWQRAADRRGTALCVVDPRAMPAQLKFQLGQSQPAMQHSQWYSVLVTPGYRPSSHGTAEQPEGSAEARHAVGVVVAIPSGPRAGVVVGGRCMASTGPPGRHWLLPGCAHLPAPCPCHPCGDGGLRPGPGAPPGAPQGWDRQGSHSGSASPHACGGCARGSLEPYPPATPCDAPGDLRGRRVQADPA
eukprot:CAMPEP_0202865494 /NCGR_PEP_ID=MMETSP1391-20130828/6196_1 /ASSEMBLY_ACC=CAM_ASM_000867 /TAXON_ID=1034604 /ORGANISM="Chlamydomonas leiostraca, Strain SAG 11-49" /LENGTH=231 /DNA_ID=CAMNT_0049545351 /DNA_START=78 /DNA_END=770 /DNA_ORIENTATION=+